MKIVHISDTHGLHCYVKPIPCDLIIHTGDFSDIGEEEEVLDFFDWFNCYPAKYKVVIAGNHDRCFDRTLFDNIIPEFVIDQVVNFVELSQGCNFYLENGGCEIEGIKIWGSPVTPTFGKGWAFNVDRGLPIGNIWSAIPPDTDILLTHGPAYDMLDELEYGEKVGCKDLANFINNNRIKYHLTGHIHSGYGLMYSDHTLISNAAICNEQYEPVNKPIIIQYK